MNDDLKPEYGNLTTEAWGELRAKARELHAAVGTNPRWQYIAIEAFPRLLEDNTVRLPRDEVIERLTDELVVMRKLNQAKSRAIIALRRIRERVASARTRASESMNPSDYLDPEGCIEDLERLVCEELGES